MTHRLGFRICIFVTLILLMGTASAAAQAPQPSAPQAPSIALNSRITFQGMLKENGVPATGSRDMIFRLYSNSTCTVKVGLDISKTGVPVAQGLFSVPLDLDPALVNGQGLWLQVTVGSTALGCQEITAAPYALGLRPGASIIGAVSSGNALTLENTIISGAAYGLAATSDSTSGRGVYGYAGATSGTTFGVYGKADSTNGTGVFGLASAASGINIGVEGKSISPTGTGIFGWATGIGDNTYGVVGQADSTYGTGVYGNTIANSGNTVGVEGMSASTSGKGVYGYATALTGITYGVYGAATSPQGFGGHFSSMGAALLAESTGGVAGIFQSTSSPANPTIRLVENGTGAARLDFTNNASKNAWTMSGNPGDGTFNVTYGDGNNSLSVLSASSSGGVEIAGSVTLHNPATGKTTLVLGQGQDVAEGFDVAQPEKLTPGSVLVIDPNNPGKLMLSTTAYDSRVAGVIAGANGLDSGVKLGAGAFDYNVALTGRVYALVDASDSDIQPGDLLTTSAAAGYAMKALDHDLSQGAILGKAMQPLAKGQKGLILILVTLQ